MKPERIEELRDWAEAAERAHPALLECMGRPGLDLPELRHLLRCARVVAELEAWLRAESMTAIEAALAKEKEKETT